MQIRYGRKWQRVSLPGKYRLNSVFRLWPSRMLISTSSSARFGWEPPWFAIALRQGLTPSMILSRIPRSFCSQKDCCRTVPFIPHQHPSRGRYFLFRGFVRFLTIVCQIRLLEKLHHPNIITYHHAWLETCQFSSFGPKVPTLQYVAFTFQTPFHLMSRNLAFSCSGLKGAVLTISSMLD